MVERVRILIVEDHQVVREGIRLILGAESDMEVVGEARDGLEAIHRAEELAPDVVLMDIALPAMNGIEAIRQIARKNPQTKVLVLSMHENREYIVQALRVGAAGYIPKRAAAAELVEAIRSVYRGGVYLHPAVAKKVVQEYLTLSAQREADQVEQTLTDREREVLVLIAEGHSTREIADLLFLSEKTVQTHRENIMRKMGFKDRVELVKYAISKGLIVLDEHEPGPV